jgi:hypothetical protein
MRVCSTGRRVVAIRILCDSRRYTVQCAALGHRATEQRANSCLHSDIDAALPTATGIYMPTVHSYARFTTSPQYSNILPISDGKCPACSHPQSSCGVAVPSPLAELSVQARERRPCCRCRCQWPDRCDRFTRTCMGDVRRRAE